MMTGLGIAGFGFLLALPILIGQWVGVVGLASGGRNPAWWCMAGGTALSTLGTIASVVLTLQVFNELGGSASTYSSSIGWMVGIGALSSLGTLIFVIGFAIHGFSVRRSVARIADLENVIAAQQEQITRDAAGRQA